MNRIGHFAFVTIVAVATMTLARPTWAGGEIPEHAASPQLPQFEVCRKAVRTSGERFQAKYTMYVSAIMPRGPINDLDISIAFGEFLEEKYQVPGSTECRAAQTREEAQKIIDVDFKTGMRTPPTVVETGWMYTPPVKVVAPTPIPYASCWAHNNARVKYYSALFDGRVDDARQWVSAFQEFLQQKYAFDGPAQCNPGLPESDALKYLKTLIDKDRATRTIDGQPPQIVETGWTYSKSS